MANSNGRQAAGTAGGATQGAMAGSALGPWGMAAGAIGGGLQGMFGGAEGYDPGKLHSRWSDPYQGRLFQDQMQRAMSGGGDFGFGQAAKAGTSQMQQMMADRGISSDSGVATAGMGNMMANAMGADIGNRRNWIGQMLNTRPIKDTSDQGWENWSSYGYGGGVETENQRIARMQAAERQAGYDQAQNRADNGVWG